MTIADKLLRAKADLDEAYQAGYQQGQQVYLSELMEWMVESASTTLTVEIYNKHPSKYLLATIVVGDQNDLYEEEVEIGPDEDSSWSFGPTTYSAEWTVKVGNVRFSEYDA